MLKLATPLIIIHLAITGMQFADAFMVSHLGDEALAALLPLANREDEDEEATWEAIYALGERDRVLGTGICGLKISHDCWAL